ncbi:MAG: hypothetical protein WB297_09290, partial [Actinomycetota bacterium]
IPTEQITGTIDRAIEIFTELGDEWGLYRSWSLLAWIRLGGGRAREAQMAASRAATHARSAGDTSAEMWCLWRGLNAAVLGPTPVNEGVAMSRHVFERVKGHPAHEASVSSMRALLEAMSGDVEAARAAIAHARLLFQELGNTHGLAGMTNAASDVELYAGDLVAAERERRSGYEAHRSVGAEAYQATSAACLADILVQLGRDDEALEFAQEGEELSVEGDISAQVPSRFAKAKVLARRGESHQAGRLAREAVSIAEGTDWLNLQGDAQMALAEVLRLAGRSNEAADAAKQAAERYERKGNVVAAGWARELLLELGAG